MTTNKMLKYNKPKHVLDMSIIQVRKTHFYDVFVGKGWKNHRRIRFDSGTISVVEGAELSAIQRAAIGKTLGEQE